MENAFRHRKAWQATATRYAQRSTLCLATCLIRALAPWARLFGRHALGDDGLEGDGAFDARVGAVVQILPPQCQSGLYTAA